MNSLGPLLNSSQELFSGNFIQAESFSFEMLKVDTAQHSEKYQGGKGSLELSYLPEFGCILQQQKLPVFICYD